MDPTPPHLLNIAKSFLVIYARIWAPKSSFTDVICVTSMLTWYVPLPQVQGQQQKQLDFLQFNNKKLHLDIITMVLDFCTKTVDTVFT